MSNPPAGWYPDPSQAQTQRYWTGTEWTEQRAPAGPKKSSGDVTVAIVIGLLIPVVGFFWGLALVASGKSAGGWVILSSVAGAFAWFMLFAGLASSGGF